MKTWYYKLPPLDQEGHLLGMLGLAEMLRRDLALMDCLPCVGLTICHQSFRCFPGMQLITVTVTDIYGHGIQTSRFLTSQKIIL